jgi:hypothetical protein
MKKEITQKQLFTLLKTIAQEASAPSPRLVALSRAKLRKEFPEDSPKLVNAAARGLARLLTEEHRVERLLSLGFLFSRYAGVHHERKARCLRLLSSR